MPDTGTGLQRQLGPFKAWQWIAAIAALGIGYYLYRSYKNNQAATNSNTGTDQTGLLNPTTGQPYAGGSVYDPYGYGYQSLQSQLTAMLIDPATGDPYFQEIAANQASQTSANTAFELQIETLTHQLTDFISHTQPVPTPVNVTVTPTPVVVAPANPTPPSPGPSPGPSPYPPQPQPYPNFVPTPSNPLLTNLPIATQIQMVLSGQANKNQLGPNALKIYNAGGISTALPTKSAVLAAQSQHYGGSVGGYFPI